MIIIYTPRFSRRYKRFSKEIKDKVREKESMFRSDPFDSQLRSHKLHGDFSGLWAFSVDHKIRIIFEFHNDNEVYFLAIGGHEIY